MKDPYLRCDTCKQRVTAEMDDKRHCELIDAIERNRSKLRQDIEELRIDRDNWKRQALALSALKNESCSLYLSELPKTTHEKPLKSSER
jgi:hypothetical protein